MSASADVSENVEPVCGNPILEKPILENPTLENPSLEEQVSALTAYGCQEIIQEAFTGKTMERPAFQALLAKLTVSDTLVVTKLDRFARTAIQGVQTVRVLFQRGVKVHILNMGLIENTLTGNLILTVMLAFAEYERGMIVERTQTAKQLLRQNPDFKDGRPKKFTDGACEKKSVNR